jgi:uncharacterized protein (UPF0276 family)
MSLKPTDIGLGLRIPHYKHIFTKSPDVDFFEIISENFMVDGGLPLQNLKKVLDKYPVVQHGVSLSIGSAEPLNFDYLKKLKELTLLTKTPFFTDHLCWSKNNSHHFHDLLPMPYTEENALYIAQKAKEVQDFIDIPFGLENLSTYVAFQSSEMTEWEFYNLVIEKSGAHMMLDINNIFVSAQNHKFDSKEYLNSVPWEKVLQCHLAGPSKLENGTYLDTHDSPVRDEVWNLYEYAWTQSNKKTRHGFPTLLEWDGNIPSFEEVHQEALKAKGYRNE